MLCDFCHTEQTCEPYFMWHRCFNCSKPVVPSVGESIATPVVIPSREELILRKNQQLARRAKEIEKQFDEGMAKRLARQEAKSRFDEEVKTRHQTKKLRKRAERQARKAERKLRSKNQITEISKRPLIINSRLDSKRDYSEYSERNQNLKKLGYATYQDYRASLRWSDIRDRVFKEKHEGCVNCGKHATQIHHERYDIETLMGTVLEYLHPICADCHHTLEFDPSGTKRSLSEANVEFGKMLANKSSKRPKKVLRQERQAMIDLSKHHDPRKMTKEMRMAWYDCMGYSSMRKTDTTCLLFGKMKPKNYLEKHGSFPPGY